MSTSTTPMAPALIPPARLWGVGRYESPDGPVYFDITWDDWARDTAWIRSLLVGHGLVSGTGIVVVGGMPESPWFDPVEAAARAIGAPFSIGEILAFEAFRTGMYARRLPIGMIFGMNLAVADGLGEELAEVLAKVPTVFCRPSAKAVIEAAGGRPFLVTRIGPALAVECPRRCGAHVNAAEWDVGVEGGQLHVTTVGPRGFQVQQEFVGVAGTVDGSPCACGSADPRVTVDPATAI